MRSTQLQSTTCCCCNHPRSQAEGGLGGGLSEVEQCPPTSGHIGACTGGGGGDQGDRQHSGHAHKAHRSGISVYDKK